MVVALALLLAGTPIGKPCPATDGGLGEIVLGLGTQKVLSVAGPVSELRVINPGVTEVKVISPQQLLIIGAGEGVARLEFVDGKGPRSYGVRVRKAEVCGLHLVELDALFPCGSTLELKMLGDRVFLDGQASSAAEWDAALIAIERYKSLVLLGRVKPEVIDALFRDANLALATSGFPKVQFVRAGDAVLLEGQVPEGDEKKVAALDAHWRRQLERVLEKPKVQKGEDAR